MVVVDTELIRVNFVRGATVARMRSERAERKGGGRVSLAVQRLCPVVILAPAPSDVRSLDGGSLLLFLYVYECFSLTLSLPGHPRRRHPLPSLSRASAF